MRTILITGAASGLGRELTLMYAQKGERVYALDIDRAKLETLPKSNIIPILADISNEMQWDTLVLPSIDKDGTGLDVVIACAAVMRVGNVLDCSLETWNFVNNINLTAQFLTAKKTMKYLIQNKGNILFIGSPSAKSAVRDEVCYITFKHAVCGLSKSIAFDYGESGVRSNVLHPGWMRTAMSDMEMQEIMDRDKVTLDEAYATVTRFVPLKRPASLNEICKACEYLTSNDASYITGAELMADGGLSIVDSGMIGFL